MIGKEPRALGSLAVVTSCTKNTCHFHIHLALTVSCFSSFLDHGAYSVSVDLRR
jgi:hypothetical protein